VIVPFFALMIFLLHLSFSVSASLAASVGNIKEKLGDFD